MHTPIGKMQAGPADPKSSSDHAPWAIWGKTRTVGRPRSLITACSLAFFNATLIPPLADCIRASEERLTPDGRRLGVAFCPVLAKSVQGVQWSATSRVAAVFPDGGVYFSLRNDSPHWVTPSKSPFPVIR